MIIKLADQKWGIDKIHNDIRGKIVKSFKVFVSVILVLFVYFVYASLSLL